MTDNTSVCLLYHRFIPGRHGGLEKTRMMVDELISVVSKNPLKQGRYLQNYSIPSSTCFSTSLKIPEKMVEL